MATARIARSTQTSAGAYVTALLVTSIGALRGVWWKCNGAGAENNNLRISIDGDYVFTLTTVSLGTTGVFIDLASTIIANAHTTTTDAVLIGNTRIPFHRELKIETQTGASGNSINALYELK